jgi:hypothetical protein
MVTIQEREAIIVGEEQIELLVKSPVREMRRLKDQPWRMFRREEGVVSCRGRKTESPQHFCNHRNVEAILMRNGVAADQSFGLFFSSSNLRCHHSAELSVALLDSSMRSPVLETICPCPVSNCCLVVEFFASAP